MVDYSAFYVRPDASQGVNALMNAARIRQEKAEFAARNALADRGIQFQEKQQNLADRRATLAEKKYDEESQMKLMGSQAKMILKALKPVIEEDSEEAFQTYRGVVGHISKTPFANTPFMQRVISDTPEKYDSAKAKEAYALVSALAEETDGKLQGSHQTFYDEKNTPYRKWVNAGEDLVLPPGHKTGDQIKADAAQIRKETGGAGGGGASPEDKKAKTEITAMSEIRKIYDSMKDPKKGIGWKPGKEIPPEYLDQINSIRKSINKPPLTKKEAEIQAEVSIFSPSTWDGKESGVTYTEDGAGQNSPTSDSGVDIGSLIERGKKLRSR